MDIDKLRNEIATNGIAKAAKKLDDFITKEFSRMRNELKKLNLLR